MAAEANRRGAGAVAGVAAAAAARAGPRLQPHPAVHKQHAKVMSALPSRTRSLRKPAESAGGISGKPGGDIDPGFARPLDPKFAQTSGQPSPSRLPTVRSARPVSLYGRPPSAAENVSSSSSMRPPPPRANTGRTTVGGVQRPSSTRVSNTASTASTEPVKTDRSRPPTTSIRHLRNPSTNAIASNTTTARGTGHARTKSSSTVLGSTFSLRPPSRELSRDSIAKPRPISEVNPQLRRPAFSTLQQHFSPAKNLAPKPHPAAFLAPPSPSKLPSNIAILAETAKLQNELLQLHLLHRDAIRVKGEWRASAKKKLGDRFKSVMDRNEELIQLEVDETGKTNAIALKNWQDQGTPGWGLEEKLQILDEVITGVWNLGQSGGKYARIVRRFERWLSRCKVILESRESAKHGDDDVKFLEELDADWKDDCQNIGRKLESWRDHLKDLGVLERGSSLATTVDGCRGMVHNMLHELSVMGQIEDDAMARESEWIRSMNGEDSDDEDIPTAGAIWRSR